MWQKDLERIHSVKAIKEDIQFYVGYTLNDYIDHGVELLKEYVNTQYGYQSKEHRVDTFYKHNNFYELVEEVFVTILGVGMQPQHFTSVVGKLANTIQGMDDYLDKVKTISEVIAVLCETDVYDIISAKYSEDKRLSVKANIELSDDLVFRINSKHYIPPMLCKPNEINKITDSPYKTIYKPLVLKHYNKHDRPLATDAINILNSTAWSIDESVLSIEEQPKAGLDEKGLKQFEVFKQQSNEVINILLNEGNKFYIPNFYDKRGREYMAGYHINLQGSEYRKALMNLHKKEIIPLD